MYVIEILLKETSTGDRDVHYDMAIVNKRDNGLWCGGNRITVFDTKGKAEEAIRRNEIYWRRAKHDWDNFDYKIWRLI